ncbi:MAG TPA: MFS transporter [Tepidisphaeraceae bacterium]|jgi:MFS family permease
MSESNKDDSQIRAYEAPEIERPAGSSPTEGELEREVPAVPALDYSPAPQPHDPYAALRIANYRRYSLGWVIAITGQQIQSVAVGWEIFDKYMGKDQARGSLALGWVGLVQALPVIALALPAGILADRFNRRAIVTLAVLISGLSSVGLAVVSIRHDPIWWLYFLLFIGAFARAIGGPAGSSLLPQIVPAKHFSNAVTWNSSFFQICSVTGPLIAGFIVLLSITVRRTTVGGPAIAYLFDAVASFIFVAMLLALSGVNTNPQRDPYAPKKSALHELLVGIRFVWRTKIILATITMDLFAVLLGGATYLLPVFAERLHVSAFGFGCLRAAPAVGAFAMAMIMAHMSPMKKAGRAMLWAVAGFGIATIIFGISTSFWLSLAMLALTGAFDNVSVVVRHTLVQVLTPDSMRGRVSAVNNVFIGASNEIGGFESGLTAALLGPLLSVVLGGIGTILTVIGVAAVWPQVRKFGSLHDAVPAELPDARGLEVTPAGTNQ